MNDSVLSLALPWASALSLLCAVRTFLRQPDGALALQVVPPLFLVTRRRAHEPHEGQRCGNWKA
jgi:hypothetical protein